VSNLTFVTLFFTVDTKLIDLYMIGPN